MATTWDWLFIAVAALLAVPGALLLLRGLFRDRARGRRRCPRCWYDMTGVPAGEAGAYTCPECGRVVRHERHLLRTRRRWRPALAGVTLIAAAALALGGADAIRQGWIGALPPPALRLVLTIWDDKAQALYNQNGGFPNTSGLTRFERLLVASHCARLLEDDLDGTRPLGRGYDFLLFMNFDQLKADGRPAVPVLGRALRTGTLSRRQLCTKALGQIGGRAAARALRRAVREDDADTVRVGALAALAKLQPPARLRRFLLAQLGNTSEAARAAAAGHLGAMSADTAAPAIARAVNATLALTHIRAMCAALTEVGPRGIIELGRLLRHERPEVRAAAAAALDRTDADASAIAADLGAALDDPDAAVRAACARTLGRTGAPAASSAPRLLALATSDPDPVVRYATLRAGARLAPAHPHTVPTLTRALTDPDIGVRHAAARELQTLGPTAVPAAEALRQAAASDEDGLVREAASDALEAMNEDGR